MKADTKAALAALVLDLRGASPDGSFTTRDMIAQTGHGEKWCRDQLRKLIDAGKARYAGTSPSTRLDGRPTSVPCYQLTKR